MMTLEELFEKAKAKQEKFRNLNFWQALWLEFEVLLYYGGAYILFNEKVYKITTKDDAIMLFLDIYDAYKDVYKKE